MDIAEVGILLWGITLGWFLMFAIRRYRVHWGAFGTFLSVMMGELLEIEGELQRFYDQTIESLRERLGDDYRGAVLEVF